MKKLLKKIIIAIISITLFAFIYTFGYRLIFFSLNKSAVKKGTQVDFSSFSDGITMVNNKNSKTLFFIPSSKEIASSELYGDWLNKLYTNQLVNIIIPPFDTEAFAPYFSGENESVSRRINAIVYLYGVYSNQVDRKHRIMILSTGDGSLAAFEIAKKYSSMDNIFLISPAHKLMNRRGGSFFHKMEGSAISHYLTPWLKRSTGRERIGPYDILNDNFNNTFHTLYGKYYPEYINMSYSRELKKHTEKVMNSIDAVKPNRFFIYYGNDDLSYSLEGFERLEDQLSQNGSVVTKERIVESGRMLLFDNGRDRIYDLINILLQ